MNKEKIEEAYKIGTEYFSKLDINEVIDLIQIGIQMALQGEVLFGDNKMISRID